MTGMGERLPPEFRDFFIPAQGFTPTTCRRLAILALASLGVDRRPTLDAPENILDFDRQPTTGTIAGVIVDALNAMKSPTEPTAGALREKLGITQAQFRKAFCRGENGTTMSGYQAAAHVRALD